MKIWNLFLSRRFIFLSLIEDNYLLTGMLVSQRYPNLYFSKIEEDILAFPSWNSSSLSLQHKCASTFYRKTQTIIILLHPRPEKGRKGAGVNRTNDSIYIERFLKLGLISFILFRYSQKYLPNKLWIKKKSCLIWIQNFFDVNQAS